MASALSSGIMPPPAPNPNPQQTTPAAAPKPGAPQGQQPPPPSHAQTVAALRHFHEMEGVITRLLKNPDGGKADMRSDVIDAVTRAVSRNYTTAEQGVIFLTNFPERPFDQKKALMGFLANVLQAADVVLQHHRMAFARDPNAGQYEYDPDNHLAHISALTKQYGGVKNA